MGDIIKQNVDDFSKKRNWNKPNNPDQLTPEFVRQLLAAQDDDLVLKFLDCVEGIIGGKYDQEFEIVKNLPIGFVNLYAIQGVEAEVNNGGYNQYYFNSAGAFAEIAVIAFETVGAPILVEIQREANQRVLDKAPLLKKYWEKNSIEAFSESYKEDIFGDLDKRFYENSKDLYRLQIKYIRAHPDHFIHGHKSL